MAAARRPSRRPLTQKPMLMSVCHFAFRQRPSIDDGVGSPASQRLVALIEEQPPHEAFITRLRRVRLCVRWCLAFHKAMQMPPLRVCQGGSRMPARAASSWIRISPVVSLWPLAGICRIVRRRPIPRPRGSLSGAGATRCLARCTARLSARFLLHESAPIALRKAPAP